MTVWWDELAKTMPETLDGLRVGIYGSAGAPYHHAALLALWGGVPKIVRAEDIRAGYLEHLDVLVMPGGGLRAMVGQLEPLGVAGANRIRHWVAAGGMYIGSCAGAFLPASVGRGFWDAHPEAAALHMVGCSLVNGGDSEFESLTSPGVGVLEVNVVDHHHWLVSGMPDAFELVHYNGPLFDPEFNPEFNPELNPEFDPELNPELNSEPQLDTLASPQNTHKIHSPQASPKLGSTLATVQAAARPVNTTPLFTPSEQFLGTGNPTTITTCLDHHALTALSSRFADGTVVLFGSHPEFGFDVLQLGWRVGVTLFANALRQQRQQLTDSSHLATPAASVVTPVVKSTVTPAVTLLELAGKVRDNGRLFAELRTHDARGWLETAPSFLGHSPEQLWLQALTRAETVSVQTAMYLEQLATSPLITKSLTTEPATWLQDDPRPNQDVGFMGLTALVQQVHKTLLAGQAALASEPKPLSFAYDGLDWHPYQLLVGSYLSAAGLAAATLLSSVTFGRLVGDDGHALLLLLVDATHSDSSVDALTHSH
jgi:hypothetical protein